MKSDCQSLLGFVKFGCAFIAVDRITESKLVRKLRNKNTFRFVGYSKFHDTE